MPGNKFLRAADVLVRGLWVITRSGRAYPFLSPDVERLPFIELLIAKAGLTSILQLTGGALDFQVQVPSAIRTQIGAVLIENYHPAVDLD